MALPVYQQLFSIQARSDFPDPTFDGELRRFPPDPSAPSGISGRTPAQAKSAAKQLMPASAGSLARYDGRALFDALCAAVGLFAMAPLFVMIAIAIKLDDGGPVFYSHVRIGRKFQKFRLYKFRSMVSSKVEGSTVTAPHDARVTRVGAFLRRFKLDELPQLINVFKGDMQLVGARPQMEKFVKYFARNMSELLESRPGYHGFGFPDFSR